MKKGRKRLNEKSLKLGWVENNHFFGKTGENNPNFGKQHSKDTKHKISEAKKGKKHTDETKQKISEALKGREFSEETKQKISEAHKGKELSEETREKLSKANKDKKLSDIHRQKISEAGMGRKHSEDTKLKMSEAKYRRKILEGVRVITDSFCCYCPTDVMKELKIGHVTFHKLFKINEDTGHYQSLLD